MIFFLKHHLLRRSPFQTATDETVPETTDLDVDSLVNNEDGAPEKAADIDDIGTGGFDLPDFDIPDFDVPVTDNTDTVQTATDETVPDSDSYR